MQDDLASRTAAFEAAAPGERAALVGDIANLRAQAAFDRHRAGPDWRPQRPHDIPALRKAVLFLMVKDEAEVIGQNLRHHHALGFRRFFVLDNASTDRTAAIIGEFRSSHPDAGLFSAHDYIVGHYQAMKMKALVSFAQTYLHYESPTPEWAFFVDADEFITCAAPEAGTSARRFASLLDDPSMAMLVFHWAQCGSAEVFETLAPDRDLFEAFPRIWPQMKVPVPKVAFRLNHDLSPIQGNHAVERFPHELSQVAVMAELGFYMFHFPMRTIAQLRRKVVNADRALSATVNRDGLGGTATHWRTYYQWYEQAGDAALRQVIAEHNQGCTQTLPPSVPAA